MSAVPSPFPFASNTVVGIVSVAAQTFAGDKTFTGFVVSPKYGANTRNNLEANEADGAASKAFVFNNTITLDNTSAALFDFQNNGTSMIKCLPHGTFGSNCPSFVLPELAQLRWGNCSIYSYLSNIHFNEAIRANGGIYLSGSLNGFVDSGGKIAANAEILLDTKVTSPTYAGACFDAPAGYMSAGRANTSFYAAGAGAFTSEGLFTHEARIANGAAAIAHKLTNNASLSTAGAKMVSVENNGTEVSAIDKDGAIQINIAGGTRPTANAANRGKLWYSKAAGGAADTVEMCLKSAADTYSWVQIQIG